MNDALLHIPVFYVFWQIGSTITAGVIYEEFVRQASALLSGEEEEGKRGQFLAGFSRLPSRRRSP